METIEDVRTACRVCLPRFALHVVLDALAKMEQADIEIARVVNQHRARTLNIEQLIEGYYHQHRAVMMAMLPCHRAAALHGRLVAACRRGEISRVPSLKLCRRVVRRLAEGG